MVVNNPLIRPYFLVVNVALEGSGPLDSHDTGTCWWRTWDQGKPDWNHGESQTFDRNGDHISGQIITTSAEVTLNGGLVRESPQNPLNSGLGIILICPDISQMLHGTGIFTYIWLRFMVNGGKYASPMRRIWVWVEISLMLVSIQVFNQERRQVWQNIFFWGGYFQIPSLKLTARILKHLGLDDDPFLLGFGLLAGANC